MTRGVALGVALIVGGWLAFDGGRALAVGDYVTPRSGDYAGQLGPWAGLVAGVGLDPRSTLIRSLHVVLGLAWLVSAGGVAARRPWARRAVLGCALATLWYLPFGTILSAVVIGVLWRSQTSDRPGGPPEAGDARP